MALWRVLGTSADEDPSLRTPRPIRCRGWVTSPMNTASWDSMQTTLRHAPDTNSQLKGAIDWQKVDSTWHETRSLASAEDVWPWHADRRPHGSPRAALGSWGDAVHQHARRVDCRSPISWGAATDLVDCLGGLLVDCVFEPSSDGASTCANVRMKPQCHVCEDTPTT